MKIFTAFTFETKEHTYTRYLSQYWTIAMCESDDFVYDCEELEEAYQKYIATRQISKKISTKSPGTKTVSKKKIKKNEIK